MSETAVIVETPRDAFQGLKTFIPTEEKAAYIRALLAAGLKHVEVGSFVHPQVVPQMADTRQVMEAVRGDTSVEFIALVANEQGVDRALDCGGFDTLGFPFSFSNEFQVRNTNKSVGETWSVAERMIAKIEDADLSFLVYVSMAFGNPYGEAWDEALLLAFLRNLSKIGVRHVALSDTVACAQPGQVRRIFERAKAEQPELELGAHFHGRAEDWDRNILAAWEAGCRRFDGACTGLGGCPFAQDRLVGNVPTEGLMALFEQRGAATGIDAKKLAPCVELARTLHQKYA